jgi:hypothetical protein
VHHGFSESNEEAKHDDDPEDENDDARNRLVLFDILNHVHLRLQKNDKLLSKNLHQKTKC